MLPNRQLSPRLQPTPTNVATAQKAKRRGGDAGCTFPPSCPASRKTSGAPVIPKSRKRESSIRRRAERPTDSRRSSSGDDAVARGGAVEHQNARALGRNVAGCAMLKTRLWRILRGWVGEGCSRTWPSSEGVVFIYRFFAKQKSGARHY